MHRGEARRGEERRGEERRGEERRGEARRGGEQLRSELRLEFDRGAGEADRWRERMMNFLHERICVSTCEGEEESGWKNEEMDTISCPPSAAGSVLRSVQSEVNSDRYA